MPFILEKLPGEPILIMKSGDKADANTDQMEIVTRLEEATRGMEGPIYRITDISAAKEMDFGMLVAALAGDYHSGLPGSAGDPRIRVVLVSDNPLIKLGAQSVRQEQYGGMEPPPVFSTLDEALDHCRKQLKG